MPHARLESPRVLVVGGASRDVLHLVGEHHAAETWGGAGLYTALAADRAGARVTMLGPRPEPMPAELARVPERLDWRGRRVALEELPRFEITHESTGPARLVSADWGAESELTPADLPDPLDAEVAYCVPFSDPALQLEFVRALSAHGCWTAAGTFPRALEVRPETVRKILASADIFFCNEDEARSLFGAAESARTRPGRLLYVTRGGRGALVIQGDRATDVAASAAEMVDPTGAGDVFAGTVLAWLGRGAHPVAAAEFGVAAASASVGGLGPSDLLANGPVAGARPDERVRVDLERTRAVGATLAADPEVAAFSFEGESFPQAGEAGTLDFFFVSTVLQFGFWLARDGGYEAPMRAPVDGRERKGTDVLFALFKRWLRSSPSTLSAAALAEIRAGDVEARLSTDDGRCPFPQMEDRVRLLRAYGRDMSELELTPEIVIDRANDSPAPLTSLLMQLDHIGGFKEDPLRKKSALLAAMMRQRPEKFLAGNEALPPIVDYHVQRSCLRMGLVRVGDERLLDRLTGRRFVNRADHDEVRRACYQAVEELVEASALTMGAVDYFLFQNRSRCPEMSAPLCSSCPMDSACAHLKDLFQPVRRVTFY